MAFNLIGGNLIGVPTSRYFRQRNWKHLASSATKLAVQRDQQLEAETGEYTMYVTVGLQWKFCPHREGNRKRDRQMAKERGAGGLVLAAINETNSNNRRCLIPLFPSQLLRLTY